MRKSLSYKVLLSVLALSTINYASPENVLAGADEYVVFYNVTSNGETVNSNCAYVSTAIKQKIPLL